MTFAYEPHVYKTRLLVSNNTSRSTVGYTFRVIWGEFFVLARDTNVGVIPPNSNFCFLIGGERVTCHWSKLHDALGRTKLHDALTTT